MLAPGVRETYRFRDVLLDVAAYELRREGRPVRLERQPMDLLILLVRRRGTLVTRSEIVDALWGADVFVEVETGVHTAVRKIRQALRDSADAPQFIETVPGKGYRFIARVEASPEREVPATTVPPASSGPDGPITTSEGIDAAARPGRMRPSRILTALAGIAVLVGIGLSWTLVRAGRPVTIAVLPFENLSGAAGTEYLADGMAEDTIVSLGRVDPARISVIGRTSMQAYRGTKKSLAEIGRELGADYLVESSLRVEVDRLRIAARLVRARDQVQVWADSFDRAVSGSLDVQHELSRDIADQVSIRLTPARADALTRRHSRNAAAYDHFLRGRNLWYQRTPDAMRQAIAAFEQAVALDPDYALAWAGLTMAHAGRAINSDADPRTTLPLARHAATRAVRVDSGLAEAQYADGYVRWLLEWDWPAGEAALRRAVELDPNLAVVQQTLGHILSQQGRHAEADVVMRRARALDPHSPAIQALYSQVAFQGRDLVAARDLANRAIALNPAFWFGYQMLGQVQAQQGEYGGALESLATAIPASGHNSKPVSLRGYVLARQGRTDEARAVLAELEATATKRYVPPYAMAVVAAGLGDDVGVFTWLERAYAARDVHLMYLPVDPKWDPFRADPRFIALLTRCDFARR